MIRKPEVRIEAGSPVRVVDKAEKPVGTGFYNPRTDLALRMFADEHLDADAVTPHLVDALAQAVELRETTFDLPRSTNAYRLVHAEGDGLPGLVIDRLGDVVVAEVGCLGTSEHLEPLGEWLLEHMGPKTRLLLLQDASSAKREGMPRLSPPRPVEAAVEEFGLRFAVRAGSGHKTGFFADQRDNRQWVRRLAKGRRVADLCTHAGGFALNAARGGAKTVTAVDLDEDAVDQVVANARSNDLRVTGVHADAFDHLREMKRGDADLLILDPPKWVGHRSELEAGCRRYRDLNRLGFEKLDRGGILVTCSCSGSVSEARFLKILEEAAGQAGRDARILAVRGAGIDHPVALECPETRYLKVVFLQVR